MPPKRRSKPFVDPLGNVLFNEVGRRNSLMGALSEWTRAEIGPQYRAAKESGILTKGSKKATKFYEGVLAQFYAKWDHETVARAFFRLGKTDTIPSSDDTESKIRTVSPVHQMCLASPDCCCLLFVEAVQMVGHPLP